jgi:hypothetical protein
MTTLLDCEKSEILASLDAFAMALLYAPQNVQSGSRLSKLEFSESLIGALESLKLSDIEEDPKPLAIGLDRLVHVSVVVEDDEFICDLPGFVMMTDEANADSGIPLNMIRIFNSDTVIDLDGSDFTLAPQIARSFHFNTVAKFYRQDGAIRVGLFGTKPKGPLAETRRGPAIHSDGLLILPLDGEIPFRLHRCEWKVPSAKTKVSKPAKSKTVSKSEEKKIDVSVQLSLLSGFSEDIVPPIPFSLVSERESAVKSHVTAIVRERRRKG